MGVRNIASFSIGAGFFRAAGQSRAAAGAGAAAAAGAAADSARRPAARAADRSIAENRYQFAIVEHSSLHKHYRKHYIIVEHSSARAKTV